MKKFLFLFICMFALACNRNEEDVNSVDSTGTIETIVNLQRFNDSLPDVVPSRGIGRWCVTFGTDALAAIPALNFCTKVAGVITAISGGTAGPAAAVGVWAGAAFLMGSASYGAYKSQSGCKYAVTVDDYLSLTKQNILMQSIQDLFYETVVRETVNGEKEIKVDSIYDYTGILHNNILSCIETSNTRSSLSDNYDENVEKNCHLCYGNRVFTDAQIINMTKNVCSDMQSFCENNNYNTTITDFVNKSYISENAGLILRLLFKAVLRSVKDELSMNVIIDRYRSEIERSRSLSNNDKEVLLLSVETMRYSFSYWNRKGVLTDFGSKFGTNGN